MLNIISKSINNRKTRGPKKVVDNLILGLKKINYPFVVNKELNSCDRLWIHDDIDALMELDKIDKDIGVIVGPNLFVNPENIPGCINLSRVIYLQPSENVKKVWLRRGYSRSQIEIWPVGVDTDKYIPSDNKKENVLIYFKNRDETELEKIENALKNKGVRYEIIRYGKYHDKEYLEKLRSAKYIIWLGVYESQGIAMEEALSCNVPILVLNKNSDSILDINSTSAAYFDNSCGTITNTLNNLSDNIDYMERKYTEFKPREFVLKNLEAGRQSEALLQLYEKYFKINSEKGERWADKKFKNYKTTIFKKILNIYHRKKERYSLYKIYIKVYKMTLYKLIQRINLLYFKYMTKKVVIHNISNGEINY